RAYASAAAKVASSLASGVAASRQARAASNSDGIASGGAARLLGVVRAQLADTFEIARLDAGDVVAVEARGIEVRDLALRARHRLLEVGQVLVDEPVDA